MWQYLYNFVLLDDADAFAVGQFSCSSGRIILRLLASAGVIPCSLKELLIIALWMKSSVKLSSGNERYTCI